MLPLILTLLASTATGPTPAATASQDPAVRIWMNKDGFVEPNDKVRVYVRTGVDGYVTILHAEPSGRVRVLFPLDPDDDNWVRSGRDYEVRSRSDREAFRVYDGSGTGVIVAVVSRDPFRYEGLVLNRHWDYRAVSFAVGTDAETDLLDVAHAMTGGAWFDYDVVRYDVGTYMVADGGGAAYALSIYGPSYAGHYWTGGVGFTIGFGVGWNDPWYYPYYSPYYWGYYPGYWDPYYGWYYPRPVHYYGYYPYYPNYYYPPGYYRPAGPTYARHHYAAGSYYTGYYASQSGAWGSYAFKSYDDRYGLNPRSVEARRRVTTSRGAYAAAGSTTPAAPGRAARRTTAATGPAAATPPVAQSGRRTAGASQPATGPARDADRGALEARRRTTGAAAGTPSGGTRLPTIHGRRRAALAQPDEPVTGGDPRDIAGDRRSAAPGTVAPTPGTDPARRSFTPTTGARDRQPATGGTVQNGARVPTGIRQITPQRVPSRSATPGTTPSATRSRQPVGTGRTLQPSSGSLQRRLPGPTVTPPRTGSTTRAAPSRSVPRATPSRPAPSRSAPRAAPSRAPTRSAPARSAPPRRRN